MVFAELSFVISQETILTTEQEMEPFCDPKQHTTLSHWRLCVMIKNLHVIDAHPKRFVIFPGGHKMAAKYFRQGYVLTK